ncbi:MAG: type IV pilus assembly protein PilM [Candidatus Vogelbacteria bacterium]|nr:type IV pilus assembly protein PilM [Candidatus Vogelbacteria bacterium]
MPNPFSNLFGLNKLALFQKQSNSVVGVDIGSSSIKVVQLKKDHGKAVLETYGEIALGPYATSEIGQATSLDITKITEALEDVMRESNVNTKRASVSIPLRSSFITLIDIPASDSHIVDQIVPIEARKYVPVPVSEVTLDWWIIPKPVTEGPVDARAPEAEKVNGVEVLLVAIHNTIIQQYKDIVTKLELQTGGFEIETFSAVRAVMGHDLLPVLVLDMGASSTKISIVDYGVIKATQTISKGSQDMTLAISKSMGIPFAKAEEIKRKVGLIGQQEGDIVTLINPVLEYVFYEANEFLVNYQRKYKRSIAKVIMIGSGSLLQGLSDIAKKSFGVEVTYGDPFRKVEAPAFLDNVLKDAGPTFSVAVGLALRAIQEQA